MRNQEIADFVRDYIDEHSNKISNEHFEIALDGAPKLLVTQLAGAFRAGKAMHMMDVMKEIVSTFLESEAIADAVKKVDGE